MEKLGPLERGLNVLKALAESPSPMGFTELNQTLGEINKATLSKILKVLQQMGYVRKVGAQYACGRAMNVFKNVELPDFKACLIQDHKAFMEDLVQKYPVSTILFMREGQNMRSIFKVVHESAPAMQEIGTLNDLAHPTPWNELLRVELNLEPVEHEVEAFAEIRATNIAVDAGRTYSDVYRYGIALRADSGEMVACLALGMFMGTTSSEFAPKVVEELKQYLLIYGGLS